MWCYIALYSWKQENQLQRAVSASEEPIVNYWICIWYCTLRVVLYFEPIVAQWETIRFKRRLFLSVRQGHMKKLGHSIDEQYIQCIPLHHINTHRFLTCSIYLQFFFKESLKRKQSALDSIPWHSQFLVVDEWRFLSSNERNPYSTTNPWL